MTCDIDLCNYTEYCNECEANTEYTILDVGSDDCIECAECHRRMLPCDLCIYHDEHHSCGVCDIQLAPSINSAMYGIVILETYSCDSDEYFIEFALKETDLREIIQTLNEYTYEWFTENWDWDLCETVFLIAKNAGYEMIQKTRRYF